MVDSLKFKDLKLDQLNTLQEEYFGRFFLMNGNNLLVEQIEIMIESTFNYTPSLHNTKEKGKKNTSYLEHITNHNVTKIKILMFRSKIITYKQNLIYIIDLKQ